MLESLDGANNQANIQLGKTHQILSHLFFSIFFLMVPPAVRLTWAVYFCLWSFAHKNVFMGLKACKWHHRREKNRHIPLFFFLGVNNHLLMINMMQSTKKQRNPNNNSWIFTHYSKQNTFILSKTQIKAPFIQIFDQNLFLTKMSHLLSSCNKLQSTL